MSILLECRNVTKYYGGLAAVQGLSFQVNEGEIYGIAGPNGAGKTTLFDVISAHTPISAGEIYFRGIPIHKKPSFEIYRLGIARTFQIPVVFQSQSVLMNVVVGSQFGCRGRSLISLLRFDGKVIQKAFETLERVGLAEIANEPSANLSLFDKKRLMLASALVADPQVLLLDEPVGGLNVNEINELMGLIRKIRDEGVTVIIIEHIMRALMGLSDRVLIMHYGQKLFEGLPEEASRDQQVLAIYLGEQFSRNKSKQAIESHRRIGDVN
jgi:branched-chain amino acid transport system ATP-binding protein